MEAAPLVPANRLYRFLDGAHDDRSAAPGPDPRLLFVCERAFAGLHLKKEVEAAIANEEIGDAATNVAQRLDRATDRTKGADNLRLIRIDSPCSPHDLKSPMFSRVFLLRNFH